MFKLQLNAMYLVINYASMNMFAVLVHCDEPNAPANGTVSVTNGTKYGAKVDFGCDTGFRLIGNARSVCHLSGQWEPGTPTCQLIGPLYYLYYHIM